MILTEQQPATLSVPLRQDASGTIRVGESRVLLELVIRAFQEGATPEAIVQTYDTLRLADVYAVIGYYLVQPAPIDEYLQQRESAAEATRLRIEAGQPSRSNLRATLLTRAGALATGLAPTGVI
jgi:uncharacterized protein (DUF433 family)